MYIVFLFFIFFNLFRVDGFCVHRVTNVFFLEKRVFVLACVSSMIVLARV